MYDGTRRDHQRLIYLVLQRVSQLYFTSAAAAAAKSTTWLSFSRALIHAKSSPEPDLVTGKLVGCRRASTSGAVTYFFFQVVYIRNIGTL